MFQSFCECLVPALYTWPMQKYFLCFFILPTNSQVGSYQLSPTPRVSRPAHAAASRITQLGKTVAVPRHQALGKLLGLGTSQLRFLSLQGEQAPSQGPKTNHRRCRNFPKAILKKNNTGIDKKTEVSDDET